MRLGGALTFDTAVILPIAEVSSTSPIAMLPETLPVMLTPSLGTALSTCDEVDPRVSMTWLGCLWNGGNSSAVNIVLRSSRPSEHATWQVYRVREMGSEGTCTTSLSACGGLAN